MKTDYIFEKKTKKRSRITRFEINFMHVELNFGDDTDVVRRRFASAIRRRSLMTFFKRRSGGALWRVRKTS